MMFWALAGVLTALAAGFTAAPLARSGQNRALILCLGILVVTLGLYLRLGQPE